MTPKMKDTIPEGWHTYTLGEIYTERKEAGDPELPILTVSIHSGVSDGALDEEEIGKTVKRIADKTQYKTARAGDLVFNMMRAWQGAIGVARSDGLVSPAYIVATPNEELVYPLFMDYYMKSPKMVGIINRQSYGVTDFRKRLYWDSFAPIKCTLPSIAEQRKIVDILSAQYKIIKLKEELIIEKQQQKKYLMQQLLTGEKRLLQKYTGWIRSKGTFHFSKGTQINGDELNDFFDYPMFNGGTKPSGYTKEYNCEDTVIISEGGNSCGFVNWVRGKFWAGGHCYYVTDSKINLHFLYQLLKYQEKRIMDLRVGSGLPNIQKKSLEEIVLFYPSDIEEQSALEKILRTADQEIELLTNIAEIEKQKAKALMQLLLTGIVRV